MKIYKKAKATVIEISTDDIIQTSNLTVGSGNLDLNTPDNGGIEYLSLHSQSDATGNVFQK